MVLDWIRGGDKEVFSRHGVRNCNGSKSLHIVDSLHGHPLVKISRIQLVPSLLTLMFNFELDLYSEMLVFFQVFQPPNEGHPCNSFTGLLRHLDEKWAPWLTTEVFNVYGTFSRLTLGCGSSSKTKLMVCRVPIRRCRPYRWSLHELSCKGSLCIPLGSDAWPLSARTSMQNTCLSWHSLMSDPSISKGHLLHISCTLDTQCFYV